MVEPPRLPGNGRRCERLPFEDQQEPALSMAALGM